MNFEIIVRQVEEGKIIKESLIKEIQVSEESINILLN